jgi:hypothetical protein
MGTSEHCSSGGTSVSGNSSANRPLGLFDILQSQGTATSDESQAERLDPAVTAGNAAKTGRRLLRHHGPGINAVAGVATGAIAGAAGA